MATEVTNEVATKLPSWLQRLSYGAFGFPLAALALPVYVYVPKFYADQFALPLAWIGLALLLTRLFDAVLDPLLGYGVDRLAAQQSDTGQGDVSRADVSRAEVSRAYARAIRWALLPLLLGFTGLFMPPLASTVTHTTSLLWLMAMLLCAYVGFSLATIVYQTWGAALGHDPASRVRWVASREAATLVGVMVAATVPQVFGMPALVALFWASLGLTAWALLRARAGLSVVLPAIVRTRVQTAGETKGHTAVGKTKFTPAQIWAPLQQSGMRWLVAVFLLNGIAASIPATLFLFFVQDVLGLAAYSGAFLALYFFAGALALPLWVKLADRIGQVPAWAVGMLVAVLAFIWAYFLPHSAYPGWGYAVVCALSGMALGADLTLPSALLAGLIDEQSKQAQNGNPATNRAIQGGTYFGLWNCLSKLNLALAAGVALPLLQLFGYVGQANPSAGDLSLNVPALPAGSAGLQALVVAYAVVPCVLKLLALGVLWRSPLRHLGVDLPLSKRNK